VKVSTKERVWDVVGRPRWWLVNGLAIALWLTAIGAIEEKVDAAAPTGVSAAEVHAPAKICVGPGAEEINCKAKKRAKQFKAGKLGNAKGIKLPKSFQRKFKKAAARSGAKLPAGCCDWITDPLKQTACLVTNPTGVHNGTCSEGQKSVNKTIDKVGQVLVVCGGSAAVGVLPGGKAVGVGSGFRSCLWGAFFAWWYAD
jgi:hypothetical protein